MLWIFGFFELHASFPPCLPPSFPPSLPPSLLLCLPHSFPSHPPSLPRALPPSFPPSSSPLPRSLLLSFPSHVSQPQGSEDHAVSYVQTCLNGSNVLPVFGRHGLLESESTIQSRYRKVCTPAVLHVASHSAHQSCEPLGPLFCEPSGPLLLRAIWLTNLASHLAHLFASHLAHFCCELFGSPILRATWPTSFP